MPGRKRSSPDDDWEAAWYKHVLDRYKHVSNAVPAEDGCEVTDDDKVINYEVIHDAMDGLNHPRPGEVAAFQRAMDALRSADDEEEIARQPASGDWKRIRGATSAALTWDRASIR